MVKIKNMIYFLALLIKEITLVEITPNLGITIAPTQDVFVRDGSFATIEVHSPVEIKIREGEYQESKKKSHYLLNLRLFGHYLTKKKRSILHSKKARSLSLINKFIGTSIDYDGYGDYLNDINTKQLKCEYQNDPKCDHGFSFFFEGEKRFSLRFQKLS